MILSPLWQPAYSGSAAGVVGIGVETGGYGWVLGGLGRGEKKKGIKQTI